MRFLGSLVALCCGIFTLHSALNLALGCLHCRWERWFDNVVRHVFFRMDLDGSGKLDQKELYAGTLLVYLKLKSYVKVDAPSNARVLELMRLADVDLSGTLSYQEFHSIMHLLSSQILARVCIQLVFVVSCPFLASYLLRLSGPSIRRARRSLSTTCSTRLAMGGPLGRWLRAVLRHFGTIVAVVARRLPPTLPATMLSAAMMLAVPIIFEILDGFLLRG